MDNVLRGSKSSVHTNAERLNTTTYNLRFLPAWYKDRRNRREPLKHLKTEQCSVVGTTASYSRGAVFASQPVDWLTWLRISWFSSVPPGNHLLHLPSPVIHYILWATRIFISTLKVWIHHKTWLHKIFWECRLACFCAYGLKPSPVPQR